LEYLNKHKEDLKEGRKCYATFVCIDYVESTKLIEEVGENDASRRINFYRDTVDRIFENFKGIGKGWSGKRNTFYFFYDNENKAIEDSAVKAAIDCLRELKVGIEVEIPVRISIGSGIVEYKDDPGKITSIEISYTGHIKSACPENSILITENVYFGLSEELKNKFKVCGITKRDRVFTFIYPREKKDKINKDAFLVENEDYSKDYFNYINFIEGDNKILLVTGIRQIEKIPTLDLEEGFFPLRLEKAEKKFIGYGLIKKIEEEKRFSKRDLKELIGEGGIPFNFPYAIKKDKHIVILGDPGSGKTTLLKYIALIYARGLKKIYERLGFDEKLLPVFVPISAIYSQTRNKPSINFIEAISSYYNSREIKNTEKFIEENLEKGKCIVLLDGLDEIPDFKGRLSITKEIEDFIRRYRNNRFIITSRIIGYEKINIDSITEYLVSPLDEKEIEKFVNNWFMAFERKVKKGMPENAIKKVVNDETEGLLKSIKEDKNIYDLAKNPFLLTLICLVQKSGYKLPRYRIELYKIIVETLFETWVIARNIAGKGLVEARDYKEGEKVLAPLALWMHENCPGGIEKEEKLKEKIIEIMKKRGISEDEGRKVVDEFFKYLAEQTQLIIPKGRDYYGFRHLSFEEFLSARALIMEEKYDDYLKKYSDDPRWKEIFLLTAGWLGIVDGREKEVTKIVEKLMKSEKIEVLLLAGEIVAEDLGVKKDIGKEVINKIGEKWLKLEKEGIINLRADVFKIFDKTLLRNEGKEIYQKFIGILKDRKIDEWIRITVAMILPFVKIDENIKKIVVEILKDKGENRDVREIIASGLCPLVNKDENVKKMIIEILQDKEENRVLKSCIALSLFLLGKNDEQIKKILKDYGVD